MKTMKILNSFGSLASDERLVETEGQEETKHFNIRKSPFYRNSVVKGKSLAHY